MRKVLYIFLVFTISFSSCSRTSLLGVRLYDDFQSKIRSHEWVSFDVARKSFDNGNLYSVNCTAKVVIHNNPNYLVVLYPDYSLFISSDSAVYIHDYYQEIATYIPNYNKKDLYNNMLVPEIGNILSMLPSYSSIIETQSWAKIDDTTKYAKTNGRHYAIKGKHTVKYCFENECILLEKPLIFFIDTATRVLDSVADFPNESGFSSSEEVSNISYENRQQLIDSIFNLNNFQYKDYTYQNDESKFYIYSRSAFSATNNEVMDFPLINVETKDTVTLKNFKGWTLIDTWTYYNGKGNLKHKVEKTKGLDFLDNVIYVMPYSNRLEETKMIADEVGVSSKTYCAKMIAQKLGIGRNKCFLISPKNEIVYSCPFINEETIEEIKKIVNHQSN